MKSKTGVYTFGFWLLAMCVNVQAAIADIYHGAFQGYYTSYEGRLAGFIKGHWDLYGTGNFDIPHVTMSIESEIQPTNFGPTPVTFYSYDDVMATNSEFTADEQVKLSRIGYLMSEWMVWSNAIISDSAPPATCMLENIDYQICVQGASIMNVQVWNIWSPGSVPLSNAPFDNASMEEGYAYYTSGAFDQMDWSAVMTVQRNSGGGGLHVVPLGGFILPAEAQSLSQVPIPAAVWLFSSGLLGLIGLARRKKAA